MTDQEVVDFLSKEFGRAVSFAEAQDIHKDLKVLADLEVDSHFDFKERGLIEIEPVNKKVVLKIKQF